MFYILLLAASLQFIKLEFTFSVYIQKKQQTVLCQQRTLANRHMNIKLASQPSSRAKNLLSHTQNR